VFFEPQVIKKKYAVFLISCTTPNRPYCVILNLNYHIPVFPFSFQMHTRSSEFNYLPSWWWL